MSHDKTPYYSIIVPSYNRAEEIKELLQSFTNLQFPRERFELIIADDGSTDQTESVVREFQQATDLQIKFYRQENQGPGVARNMGMTKAQGEVFIFIDSDCTVAPNWLSAIDRALDSEKADAFGGPDSFREDFPPLLKAINYSMTSFITTGGIRGHKKKSLGKYYPRSFNMGLRRHVYVKIGGFGTLRHGQDIEYSHRILQSGAKIIRIPDAIVYHKRRTSLKKFFRQVFNWGVARINLYLIDKKMLEPVHALPAIATAALFLLLLLSIKISPVWEFTKLVLISGIIVLGASAIHAGISYKSVKVAFFTPFVMCIQIFGYGMGFITAFIRRVIFKKPAFTGFQKRYYQ
jgi:glycosyltransferase involved in cell wall biosynthesis